MPKLATKPVIAVDIDDVLGLSADEFIKYTNKKWGTNLSIEDYDEHWGKVWKIDNQQEAERRSHEYIQYANPLVKKNPDALKILSQLSKNHKLVIATSRRLQYQNETRDWLQTHFGNLFGEIHYAKIWDEVTKERIAATKTEILSQIGADYLIDDQPKHCIGAAKVGIKAILFGDYAWNRDIKLQPNMVRAKNWQKVLEYFERESAG
jgi:uncharacterized HAD superfamily protein